MSTSESYSAHQPSNSTKETPTRRLITLLLIAIPVLVLAAGQPSPSFGLRAEGTLGGGVIVPICAEKAVGVSLSKSPPVTGDKYFLDSKI